MVKLVWFPIQILYGVAVGADPREMIIWRGVATFAGGRGVLISAGGVAGFAGDGFMSADQGVETVVNVFIQERNGFRANGRDRIIFIVKNEGNITLR